MRGWLASSGQPIPIELLLLQPSHALIDQHLHS